MLQGRADATFQPVPYEAGSRLADAERALARIPVAVWLLGIVTLSALFRFWIARSSPTPWILPDEYIYSELSRSLADLGHFSVNGGDGATWSYGPLYPLLIAPAWIFTGSTAQAYAAIQLINSVMMSSAAIFAYLLGRRVLDRRQSFFLAVLTLLVPSMVYSSKAMTESLAYPVFLAAVLAITVALERPRCSTQLLALLAIGVAILTRAEMIMLAPAFLTGIVLVTAFAGGGRRAFLARLSAFRLTLYVLGALFLSGVVWLLVQRGDGFGARGHWLHVLDFLSLPRWLLIYIGELDLYVGIVPFAAFVLMLVLAGQGKLLTATERALVAVIASIFFWLLLLVATYSTQPRGNPLVNDRYLFYLVPLELLVFLLWIKKGAPRPRRLAFVAAAIAMLAPAAVPFATFLNGHEWSVSSSTVALVPWGILKPALGAHGQLLAVILVIAGVGAAAFLRVPARRDFLLRFLVILNFLFITLFVLAANAVVSEKAKDRWLAPNSTWVDEAVEPGAQVVGIWALQKGATSVPEKVWDRWNALSENQLANQRIVRVYAFEKAYDVVSPSRPFVGDALEGSGGRLLERGRPISADYVLVGPELEIRGVVIARDPHSGLVLYRVNGSPTLR
jgi:Dolichyl-phosphate-mannose-protein mannosyltransferase